LTMIRPCDDTSPTGAAAGAAIRGQDYVTRFTSCHICNPQQPVHTISSSLPVACCWPMIKLEASARRHALQASITSVAVYTFYTACWLLSPTDPASITNLVMALLSLGLPLALLLFMPLERIADLLAKHLQPEPAPTQFSNVVSEIAVALAEPVESIQTCKDSAPNLFMLPCTDQEIVVASQGALKKLNRYELQALVAAQFAGLRNPWCRLATKAEIMWWALPGLSALALPAFLFGFGGAGIVSFLLIFVALFTPRWIEQARDLCADVAAVRTTLDPSSLASAMRKLAPHAYAASQISMGKWYLPTNPFLVIPRRVHSTTTVTTGGAKRRWDSSDEVRMELLLRADRAEAMTAGADPREFTGREYRRRWAMLGQSE